MILAIIADVRDRQELQKVSEANDFLRERLGQMTIALTQKDKEIDQLQKSPCPPAAPPENSGRKRARLQ
jgi:hypothetical protein